MGEFFCTVFSPIGPGHDLADFSAPLLHPIVLNSTTNYKVGVINFYHPPVLHAQDSVDKKDLIRFKNFQAQGADEAFDLDQFVQLVAESVADPNLYNRKYLEEFYDVSNYDKLGVSSGGDNTSPLKKYDISTLTASEPFAVQAWPVVSAVRNSGDARENFPHNFRYVFYSNFNYTLKQLLYSIVLQTHQHITQGNLLSAATATSRRVSLGEHLFHVLRTCVIRLYNASQKTATNTYQNENTYKNLFIALHCNIIQPQQFNGHLKRVIYTRFVKPVIDYSGGLNFPVNPVRYYPVKVKRIDSIDFEITDENFSKVHFVDDTSKICVVLHFKPSN